MSRYRAREEVDACVVCGEEVEERYDRDLGVGGLFSCCSCGSLACYDCARDWRDNGTRNAPRLCDDCVSWRGEPRSEPRKDTEETSGATACPARVAACVAQVADIDAFEQERRAAVRREKNRRRRMRRAERKANIRISADAAPTAVAVEEATTSVAVDESTTFVAIEEVTTSAAI